MVYNLAVIFFLILGILVLLYMAYGLVRTNINKFLGYLFVKNNLRLGSLLAILARKFFLREFSPLKKYYSSLSELNKIVKESFNSQSTNKIYKRLNNYNKKNQYGSIINKKVLFIYGHYVKNDKSKINSNFLDWLGTSKNAGCITKSFFADEISYNPESEDNELVLEAETKRLLEEVSKFKPDLVFIDTNYTPNKRTINVDTIALIKSISSAKIVGVAGDVFTEDGWSSVNLWADFLDCSFYCNSGWRNRAFGRTQFIPWVVDNKRFYPAKKDKGIFFSGIANIPRYCYIFIAKKYCQENNLKHHIVGHNRNIGKGTLTLSDYDLYTRQSIAAIEITARSKSLRTGGGRTNNTIPCKTLLVMEKADIMDLYYVPFIHYIPYNTKRELEIALQFTKDSKDLVSLITDTAYEFYLKNYQSDKIWQQIFFHAFNEKIK